MSYDDCLEDKREDYPNCSVLCCVQQLCTMIHTHEQFLKMRLGLGLVFVHGFNILCVLWFSLGCYVLVLFAFVVLDLVSPVLSQEICWEERLRNVSSGT